MYTNPKIKPTKIETFDLTEGQTIEEKMRLVMQNKEPIEEGAPLIYTPRNEGVSAGYNIRTDRFDIAMEGMKVVHKSAIAQRDAKNNPPQKEDNKEVAGSESIQGSNE